MSIKRKYSGLLVIGLSLLFGTSYGRVGLSRDGVQSASQEIGTRVSTLEEYGMAGSDKAVMQMRNDDDVLARLGVPESDPVRRKIAHLLHIRRSELAREAELSNGDSPVSDSLVMKHGFYKYGVALASASEYFIQDEYQVNGLKDVREERQKTIVERTGKIIRSMSPTQTWDTGLFANLIKMHKRYSEHLKKDTKFLDRLYPEAKKIGFSGSQDDLVNELSWACFDYLTDTQKVDSRTIASTSQLDAAEFTELGIDPSARVHSEWFTIFTEIKPGKWPSFVAVLTKISFGSLRRMIQHAQGLKRATEGMSEVTNALHDGLSHFGVAVKKEDEDQPHRLIVVAEEHSEKLLEEMQAGNLKPELMQQKQEEAQALIKLVEDVRARTEVYKMSARLCSGPGGIRRNEEIVNRSPETRRAYQAIVTEAGGQEVAGHYDEEGNFIEEKETSGGMSWVAWGGIIIGAIAISYLASRVKDSTSLAEARDRVKRGDGTRKDKVFSNIGVLLNVIAMPITFAKAAKDKLGFGGKKQSDDKTPAVAGGGAGAGAGSGASATKTGGAAETRSSDDASDSNSDDGGDDDDATPAGGSPATSASAMSSVD